jgi:hypothetical protein
MGGVERAEAAELEGTAGATGVDGRVGSPVPVPAVEEMTGVLPAVGVGGVGDAGGPAWVAELG